MIRLGSFCIHTLALLATGACATWRPYEAGPNLQPGQSLPYQLRATRSDSSRIAITDPFIRSDTLYGRTRGDTIAVPLADVAGLERSRIDGLRTIGVLVGVPAVGLGVAYLVLCVVGDCQPDYLQPGSLLP